MATIDLSSYKKLYLETAKEYADTLSANYDKILSTSMDKDALKNMYIAAHSLKSQSQVMGYIKIGKLCAMIEKTLKEIIENNTHVSRELLKMVGEKVKGIEKSIEILNQALPDQDDTSKGI